VSVFITLFAVALLIAFFIMLFSIIWYSKFVFGPAVDDIISSQKVKYALFVEFCSSFLIAISVLIVFNGLNFNFTFGVLNGFLIAFAIILPIAISESLWRGVPIRKFAIFTLHRILQVVIAFSLSGLANQILFGSHI
jgi:hypothetical protein